MLAFIHYLKNENSVILIPVVHIGPILTSEKSFPLQ